MGSVVEARPGTAGKLERIRQLADNGLNTPRLIQIDVGTRFDDDLRARLRTEAAGERLMTIRTYHPTDETTYARGPFFPEIPVEEAIRRAEELSREWHVLYQEAIDVGDTLFAGNLLLAADGSGTYEVLAGPYRVRDVEQPPPGAEGCLRQATFGSPAEIPEAPIREAVQRVLASGLIDDVAPAGEPVVIEFNVQRRPVGRLREPILFWEWRPLRRSTRRTAEAVEIGVLRSGTVYGMGIPYRPVPPTHAQPAVLGGKGFSLWRMAEAGLPVPPAIVLSAPPEVRATLPEPWEDAIDEALEALRAVSANRAVSVRSSPTVSMPGMLATVLDVEPTVDELRAAIRTVLKSWSTEPAIAYRRDRGIGGAVGLAVVVQPMVYADRDERSGSGVGFSRSPLTGEPQVVLEYAERALGSEIVGGVRTPLATEEVGRRYPNLWETVSGCARSLERLFGDMQEFEFAVESGRFHLLQSRPGKRTQAARVRIAHDLLTSGLMSEEQALEELMVVDLDRLVQRRLETSGAEPLALARVAAPGAAVGRVALGRKAVGRLRAAGEPVVLCARTTNPSDYPLMRDLVGLVTRHGGVTSHAAVAALEAGIVALVGCEALEIDDERAVARFAGVEVGEDEWLSIEGADVGRIYTGQLSERPAEFPPGLTPELLDWARRMVDRRRGRASQPAPTLTGR